MFLFDMALPHLLYATSLYIDKVFYLAFLG